MNALQWIGQMLVNVVAWFGGESRTLTRLAMREERGGVTDPTEATHAEQVMALSVVTTVSRVLRKRAPMLVKREMALLTRVAGATTAEQARAHFRLPSRAVVREAREREYQTRHAAILEGRVDLDRPLMSRRWLSVVEAALVIADVGFWYAVLGKSINHNAPDALVQQIFAAVLAVVFPAAAIWLAHLGGGAFQRLIKHREPGRRLEQFAAALLSLALMVALTCVLWGVIVWRFTPSDLVGALDQGMPVPVGAIATTFVLTIFVDMVVRIFAVSEIHEQRLARDLAVVTDRGQSDQLGTDVVRANGAWAMSWQDLAAGIDQVLSEIEQVVCAGERVLLMVRSMRPSSGMTQPAPNGTAATTDKVLATSAQLPWHLDVRLLQTLLRQVWRANQVLAEYQPPSLAPAAMREETAANIRDLETRVESLTEVGDIPSSWEEADEATTANEPAAREVVLMRRTN